MDPDPSKRCKSRLVMTDQCPPTGSHSTLARPHSPFGNGAKPTERRRGAQLGCSMASQRYMRSGMAMA